MYVSKCSKILYVFEISLELTRFQGCPLLVINTAILKFDSGDYKSESNELPTSSSWKIKQFVRLLSHNLRIYRSHRISRSNSTKREMAT